VKVLKNKAGYSVIDKIDGKEINTSKEVVKYKEGDSVNFESTGVSKKATIEKGKDHCVVVFEDGSQWHFSGTFGDDELIEEVEEPEVVEEVEVIEEVIETEEVQTIAGYEVIEPVLDVSQLFEAEGNVSGSIPISQEIHDRNFFIGVCKKLDDVVGITLKKDGKINNVSCSYMGIRLEIPGILTHVALEIEGIQYKLYLARITIEE
jgi:hypothetical protein